LEFEGGAASLKKDPNERQKESCYQEKKEILIYQKRGGRGNVFEGEQTQGGESLTDETASCLGLTTSKDDKPKKPSNMGEV